MKFARRLSVELSILLAAVSCTTNTNPSIEELAYVPPWAKAPGGHAAGVAATDAELKEPHFDGLFNGVYLRYPLKPMKKVAIDLGESPCPSGKRRPRVYGPDAQGSDLQFEATYLPKGLLPDEGGPGLTSCKDGTAVHYGRGWQIPEYGITVDIARIRGPMIAEITRIPQDRISEGVVAGLDAVFIQPVTKDGFGNAFVIIPDVDRKVLTYVGTINLPFSETLKIAEGVVSQ